MTARESDATDTVNGVLAGRFLDDLAELIQHPSHTLLD
jgi:hypothetical protein